MADSAGGAGINFNANATDGFGLGQIASNLSDSIFCGFDPQCRRDKNKPADAADNYTFVFGGGSGGGGGGTDTMLIALMFLLVIGGGVAIYFTSKKQ